MKQQEVDLFLQTNAKSFPADQMEELRERLLAVPENEWSKVTTLSFKNPTVVLVLAILLGNLGVDRFMLGQIGLGIVKLLTCGGCLIWGLIDWFTAMKRTRKYNLDKLYNAL